MASPERAVRSDSNLSVYEPVQAVRSELEVQERRGLTDEQQANGHETGETNRITQVPARTKVGDIPGKAGHHRQADKKSQKWRVYASDRRQRWAPTFEPEQRRVETRNHVERAAPEKDPSDEDAQ